MSHVVLLSQAQVVRVAPHFPRSRDKPRVHDRRVMRGIIYATSKGLMWTNPPRVCRCTRHSKADASAGAAYPSGE
jgi:transposase